MKIYTIKCWDNVEYEEIVLVSFNSLDIAEKAKEYFEIKNEEENDPIWSSFEIEINDIYETYEEFLKSEED